MSFTVPNATSFTDPLATLDSNDLAIMTAAALQSGVLSGCAVTQQTPAVMGVTVAAGNVLVAGTFAAVAGGNLTIATADSVNARYDLVVSNNAGAISVVTGTAATTPVYPAIPANSVVLAMVYVAPLVTSIVAAEIVDKRVMLRPQTRPSIFIAASNASSVEKGFADYICTGTSDQTTINTAIATLPNSGGTVMLSEGTFSLSGSITPPASMSSGLRLLGSGWGTILQLANSSNVYVIAFATGSSSMAGAHIGYLKIDANGQNQTSGGGINAYGAYRCLFDHVWIHNAYNEGLYLQYGPGGSPNFGFQNYVRACLIEGGQNSNGGNGKGIWTNNSDENYIVYCHFQDNGRVGGTDPASIIDFAGLQNIIGCSFVGGYFGIKLQGQHNKVLGCIFDGVHNFAVRLNGNRNLIADNTFFNIGAGAGSANSISGVYCDNVQNCRITNNIMMSDVTASNGTKSFVEFDFGSTLNFAVGNTFVVQGGSTITAPVSYNGTTGNVTRFNQGYVTEAHGTASITSGNTSVVVTHGLGLTPTLDQISVTPTSSLGSAATFWISNATSTQFTINLNANPGQTVNFGWRADVGY